MRPQDDFEPQNVTKINVLTDHQLLESINKISPAAGLPVVAATVYRHVSHVMDLTPRIICYENMLSYVQWLNSALRDVPGYQ